MDNKRTWTVPKPSADGTNVLVFGLTHFTEEEGAAAIICFHVVQDSPSLQAAPGERMSRLTVPLRTPTQAVSPKSRLKETIVFSVEDTTGRLL